MKEIILYSLGIFLFMASIRNTNKLLLWISFSGFIIISVISFANLYFVLFYPNEGARVFIGGIDRVIFNDILVSLLPFSIFLLLLLKSRTFTKSNKIDIISTLIIFSFLIQLVNLLALRTRTGWISLTILLFVFVLLSKKHYTTIYTSKQIVVFLILIIFSAILTSIYIPKNNEHERNSLIKTATSVFDANYSSNKARMSFWSTSLKIFTEYPITGIGAGKWPGLYPFYNGEKYTDENVDMNISINPHNDYLEILTEYGIFGFFIFIGFISYGIYLLYKKVSNDIIYLPYLLSALGLSITMFFSFTKDNFFAMIVFSICMGIGYSSNYESRIMNYESTKNNYKFGIMNYEFFKKYNTKRIIRNFLITIGILMFCAGIWFKVMSFLNEREYLEAMKLKAQGKYNEMLYKLNGVSDFFYPVDMNKMPVDYYRGVGYFELKEYDKALDKFKKAREYARYYPTIMNNEASALYMAGNYKEALERYLEVKRMFPNYIEPQINLLSLYTNQKRNEEAIALIADLDNKTIVTKYVKNYSVFLEIKNYFKGTLP